MSCEHKRIKSENCVISCMDCGAILPIDYLVAKEKIAAQKDAEAPAEQAAETEAPKTKGRKKKA